MHRPRFRFRLEPDAQTNKDTTQDWTMLVATYDIISGGALVVQDRDIWSMPVYDTAKLLPGSPPSWGVILLLAGVLMFVGMGLGKHRVMKAGAALAVIWNFFFAATFWDEFVHGNVGIQPLLIYGLLGFGHVILYYTYKGSNALQ